MIAVAWAAWKSRPGWKLGPGPGFVEALEAALKTGIAQGAIRGPYVAYGSAEHGEDFDSSLLHGTGPDAPWHVSTKVVHGD